MPIIHSAKKRVKTARKAAILNSKTKRSMKSSIKSFTSKPSIEAQAAAFSKIDKALKKGIIHKNKAARLKKHLSSEAKTSNLKISKTKPSTKPKTPAKKPAQKKSPAKKLAK